MDIIRVELEEKYISYVEPRDECISLVYTLKVATFLVEVPLFIL